MRFFSLEAKKSLVSVMVAFTVLMPVSASSNVEVDMISGAQMKQRINSFLASKNLAGQPAISDTRLFPACGSDITVRPLFGGLKTVELFCPDPGGFKFAVRTNAARLNSNRFVTGGGVQNAKKLSSVVDAKTQILSETVMETPTETYLVLARSVQKGHVLSHEDVTLTEARVKNRRDYFTKVSDVVGRKVKKRLSINQVILNRHLEIDWDIRKGQEIIIQSTVGPVEVVSSGISAGNAQIGELMQAENLRSRKIIEGVVVSQKKIKVLTK